MQYQKRGKMKCLKCWSRKLTGIGENFDDDGFQVRCIICNHVFTIYWSEAKILEES